MNLVAAGSGLGPVVLDPPPWAPGAPPPSSLLSLLVHLSFLAPGGASGLALACRCERSGGSGATFDLSHRLLFDGNQVFTASPSFLDGANLIRPRSPVTANLAAFLHASLDLLLHFLWLTKHEESADEERQTRDRRSKPLHPSHATAEC